MYTYLSGRMILHEMANVNANTNESVNLSEARPMSKLLLTPDGYLAISIYLTIIGLCATIGNIMVLVTIVRNRPLHRKPQVLLLLNMAVADLGISVAGYPYTTSSSYAGRWLFGDVGCQMYAFTCFFLSMASMDTLAAISIYRYIVIVKPKYQKLLTNANTAKVIALTWIYALLLTFPPLVGWSFYTYEPFGTSCSMNWQGKELGDITYIFATIFFCYVSHITVLSFCYINIVKHAARRLNSSKNGLARKRLRQELKVSLMCFIMVFCFVMVWTPYAVISVAHAFGWKPAPWVLTMPTMFAKSSCVINPIIYTFLNVRFRRMMLKMWCKCLIRRIFPLTHLQYERPRENVLSNPGIFTVARYNKEGVYMGRQDDPSGCWTILQESVMEEFSPQVVRMSLLRSATSSALGCKPPLLELSVYDLHQGSAANTDIHQEEETTPTDEFEGSVASCEKSDRTVSAKSVVVKQNLGVSSVDFSGIQSHEGDAEGNVETSAGSSDNVESPVVSLQDPLSDVATYGSTDDTTVPCIKQLSQVVENPRGKSPEAQDIQHPSPSTSRESARPNKQSEEHCSRGSADSSEFTRSPSIEETQRETSSSTKSPYKSFLSKSKWFAGLSGRKLPYQLDEDYLDVHVQTKRLHRQAYLHSRHMITSLPFTRRPSDSNSQDGDTFYDLGHPSSDDSDTKDNFEMQVM